MSSVHPMDGPSSETHALPVMGQEEVEQVPASSQPPSRRGQRAYTTFMDEEGQVRRRGHTSYTPDTGELDDGGHHHVARPTSPPEDVTFGVKPFGFLDFQKSAEEKQDPHFDDVHQSPEAAPHLDAYREKRRYRGNLMWAIFFGWWVSGLYQAVGFLLLATVICAPYGRVCINLGRYLFWPFDGRYVQVWRGRDPASSSTPDIQEGLLWTMDRTTVGSLPKVELSWAHSPASAIARIVYLLIITATLAPMHIIVMCLTWFTVAFIPMAKINATMLRLIYFVPLNVRAETSVNNLNGEIVLCTYRAAAKHYFRDSIDGINIVFVNLVPFILLALFDGYIVPIILGGNTGIADPYVIFVLSLVAVIPLVYFVGLGVACVSASSNLALGAVVNATFGSLVEIILYILALQKKKGVLVLGSIVGSLVGTNLLMPGLAMLAGGWKRKSQTFNSRSTGVTTTLLITSIFICVIPTLYYNNYGTQFLSCESCPSINGTDQHVTDVFQCTGCSFNQDAFGSDPLFLSTVTKIVYFATALLPIAYAIALYYTLKTHMADIYERKRREKEDDEEEPSGHVGPQWSRWKALTVLIVSTVLFALLAELLVQSVDVVIAGSPISEQFLGFTLFAIVPSATEYVNAFLFALHNNVALRYAKDDGDCNIAVTMEIANQYVVQVTLFQVPALVIYSYVASAASGTVMTFHNSFPLVFPMWDVISIFISMIVLAYIIIEGRTDYFKGAMLLIMYFFITFLYWFNDSLSSSSDVIVDPHSGRMLVI